MNKNLEERVAKLEREIAQLKEEVQIGLEVRDALLSLPEAAKQRAKETEANRADQGAWEESLLGK